MRTTAALAVAVACITTIASPALAGTTGVVKGIVTDTAGAPVAGVTVVLRSPSGNYPSTTDSRGFYAITGVYADTYTASFEKSGYASQVVTGLSVFADQTITLNEKLTKSLKTIATVTARSAASAFQPEQTTDTYTVNSAQIQNLQGSDFNISESNLLTSLPGVGYDSSGYPVIHGGRENEEGFQFEGIPYTDAFTNQFVNSLSLPGSGLASAQLTPGVGDASVQSGGTGVINLVSSRGTYPGYTTLEFAAGGPGFDHRFNGAMSYASANGHISDYLAFAGANSAPRYGDGTTPANITDAMTGTSLETDRETLNNLIFRFGKNNNQALQLFTDIGQHQFFQAYGGNAGYCFESCNPYLTSFYSGLYTNSFGVPLSASQVTALTGFQPYQTSPTETLAQANLATETYYQPFETYKLGYTLNINPSTFVQANLYSVNSVVTFAFPTGLTNSLGLTDRGNQLQGGHQLGGDIKLQKQINDKNFFEAGVTYAYLHPEFVFTSQAYGWLSQFESYFIDGGYSVFSPFDFVNPNSPNCGLGPGQCGYAYGAYANPPSQLTIPAFSQLSNINRRDLSYYANDKLDLSDRVHLDAGVRFETSQFMGLPAVGVQSDCTFLYNPATAPANPTYNPANPTQLGNCPYNPNFSNITNQMMKPSEVEPRLGLSLQLGKNTALRFTYDRATAFPLIGLVDEILQQAEFLQPYGKLPAYSAAFGATGSQVVSCGIAPYFVPCSSYGSQLFWAYQNLNGVPYQPVLPMTSNNYQVTLEHQFTKGFLRGIALSVAPWTRHQYNTEATVALPLLDSSGHPVIENGTVLLGPASATNLGKEFANGVDVDITKENPVGLSGQLTMSYVNEFSSVLPTSGSEDFFPSIPYSSVLAGNVYRVGFLSPFQGTLGLTYKTLSGWRINPRIQYNIGYPIGTGTLTADIINGNAMNIPNTNVIPGGAATSQGIGPAYYVDPLNPGSVLDPNIAASRGNAETSSPGGKLSPPSLTAGITLEYAPANKPYKVGFDVENIFNRYYSGAFLNGRYQPIATGIGGPLTGYSYSSPLDYTLPYANPLYSSAYGGNGVFANFPNNVGRSYYVYYSIKI